MICTVDGESVVKILDFGISKFLQLGRQNQSLTMVGETFGSPFYMSPEQSVGGDVDARSDIYSIGCSLFEALNSLCSI
jgi:serine/threonine protein kinase